MMNNEFPSTVASMMNNEFPPPVSTPASQTPPQLGGTPPNVPAAKPDPKRTSKKTGRKASNAKRRRAEVEPEFFFNLIKLKTTKSVYVTLSLIL